MRFTNGANRVEENKAKAVRINTGELLRCLKGTMSLTSTILGNVDIVACFE